jgi:hypothetical protein
MIAITLEKTGLSELNHFGIFKSLEGLGILVEDVDTAGIGACGVMPIGAVGVIGSAVMDAPHFEQKIESGLLSA